MSLLSVTVKGVKFFIGDKDPNIVESYVSVSVGNCVSRTDIRTGDKPIWNEEFVFEIENLGEGVIIEVHKNDQSGQKYIGYHFAPFCLLRYSNDNSAEANSGNWVTLDQRLYLRNGVIIGSDWPTTDYLLFDAKFDLPTDESSDNGLERNTVADEWRDVEDRKYRRRIKFPRSWALQPYVVQLRKHRRIQQLYHEQHNIQVTYICAPQHEEPWDDSDDSDSEERLPVFNECPGFVYDYQDGNVYEARYVRRFACKNGIIFDSELGILQFDDGAGKVYNYRDGKVYDAGAVKKYIDKNGKIHDNEKAKTYDINEYRKVNNEGGKVYDYRNRKVYDARFVERYIGKDGKVHDNRNGYVYSIKEAHFYEHIGEHIRVGRSIPPYNPVKIPTRRPSNPLIAFQHRHTDERYEPYNRVTYRHNSTDDSSSNRRISVVSSRMMFNKYNRRYGTDEMWGSPNASDDSLSLYDYSPDVMMERETKMESETDSEREYLKDSSTYSCGSSYKNSSHWLYSQEEQPTSSISHFRPRSKHSAVADYPTTYNSYISSADKLGRQYSLEERFCNSRSYSPPSHVKKPTGGPRYYSSPSSNSKFARRHSQDDQPMASYSHYQPARQRKTHTKYSADSGYPATCSSHPSSSKLYRQPYQEERPVRYSPPRSRAFSSYPKYSTSYAYSADRSARRHSQEKQPMRYKDAVRYQTSSTSPSTGSSSTREHTYRPQQHANRRSSSHARSSQLQRDGHNSDLVLEHDQPINHRRMVTRFLVMIDERIARFFPEPEIPHDADLLEYNYLRRIVSELPVLIEQRFANCFPKGDIPQRELRPEVSFTNRRRMMTKLPVLIEDKIAAFFPRGDTPRDSDPKYAPSKIVRKRVIVSLLKELKKMEDSDKREEPHIPLERITPDRTVPADQKMEIRERKDESNSGENSSMPVTTETYSSSKSFVYKPIESNNQQRQEENYQQLSTTYSYNNSRISYDRSDEGIEEDYDNSVDSYRHTPPRLQYEDQHKEVVRSRESSYDGQYDDERYSYKENVDEVCEEEYDEDSKLPPQYDYESDDESKGVADSYDKGSVADSYDKGSVADSYDKGSVASESTVRSDGSRSHVYVQPIVSNEVFGDGPAYLDDIAVNYVEPTSSAPTTATHTPRYERANLPERPIYNVEDIQLENPDEPHYAHLKSPYTYIDRGGISYDPNWRRLLPNNTLPPTTETTTHREYEYVINDRTVNSEGYEVAGTSDTYSWEDPELLTYNNGPVTIHYNPICCIEEEEYDEEAEDGLVVPSTALQPVEEDEEPKEHEETEETTSKSVEENKKLIARNRWHSAYSKIIHQLNVSTIILFLELFACHVITKLIHTYLFQTRTPQFI